MPPDGLAARWAHCMLLGALLACGTALAADGPTWDSLDAPVRKVLTPYAAQWPDLPEQRRAQLVESAKLWLSMDQTQREVVADRMRTWQSLSEEQRRTLRELHAHTQRGDAHPNARMRDYLERLPAAERQRLRRHMANMTPGERRTFLQGLGLAGRAGALALLRRIGAHLEPHEQRAVRSWFESLSQREREDLILELRDLEMSDAVARLRAALAASEDQRAND